MAGRRLWRCIGIHAWLANSCCSDACQQSAACCLFLARFAVGPSDANWSEICASWSPPTTSGCFGANWPWIGGCGLLPRSWECRRGVLNWMGLAGSAITRCAIPIGHKIGFRPRRWQSPCQLFIALGRGQRRLKALANGPWIRVRLARFTRSVCNGRSVR